MLHLCDFGDALAFELLQVRTQDGGDEDSRWSAGTVPHVFAALNWVFEHVADFGARLWISETGDEGVGAAVVIFGRNAGAQRGGRRDVRILVGGDLESALTRGVNGVDDLRH